MNGAIRVLLAALGVGLAAACSHLPELPQAPVLTGPEASLGLSPRERVRLAVELLGEGDAARAEVELRAALQDRPDYGAAQRLLEQIAANPRELLGDTARPYTVQPGETMSALAERYLGDPLLFYALARYNDLQAPNRLSAGQRLMIPRRAGVEIASQPSSGAAAPAEAAVRPRGVDPTRASQLRLQGLQQLNTGNVETAIALLRQAHALDEGNRAIQSNLERALRLQTALGVGPG